MDDAQLQGTSIPLINLWQLKTHISHRTTIRKQHPQYGFWATFINFFKFWHFAKFQGQKYWGIPTLGVWGVRVGRCANRRPTHNFPIPLNTKLCLISCHLARIPMSSYAPLPNSTSLLGVIVDLWRRKWYQSICRPHILIRPLYTH